MTAAIIMKLELTNQLELLHNHLIETCQIIQDFLEIENGAVPDSGENLSLKYTLSKFAIQMSSFTSRVTSMKVKLNKHPEEEEGEEPEDHNGHHENGIEDDDKNTQQQDYNLIEENKDKRKNGHTFTAGRIIKTEELEMEELPSEEEEEEEEDYQEDEEDELPFEMEEVEPFPVGDEGYDEHDEEQEEEDYNFNDEYPGTSSAEYDMHPVHVEYSGPPNLTTGRKSSSRKQTIGVRIFDESPIVPRPPPPMKMKMKMSTRPPMWNGRPVSLSTLRVMRFRSRMTEEQKIEQRRKDRERVARKRAALRAARALAQGTTNGSSNSSESYESLCAKRKDSSP